MSARVQEAAGNGERHISLWRRLPDGVIFGDGFESGNTFAWSR